MTASLRQPLELPAPHRFSREEYLRMSDDGYFDGRHVQLIDGEIIDMPVQKHSHFKAINKVVKRLEAVFGENYWVRAQGPISLNESSMPEPDVAVTAGSMESADDHPTTALLIIEVSDTTLPLDRSRKAAVYASTRIPDYWIVNLVRRQLEVHRRPVGGKYKSIVILKPDDFISPLAQPSAKIKVGDLLP